MLSGTAVAQDAAQQALQLQQQQLVQQQLAQQQQLNLINQQQLAQNINAGLGGYQLGVRSPRLRQEAGPAPGTVVVPMEDPSRGASIFYTTDGWTPTPVSERYMGPVTIRQRVTVQAIAIAAGGLRSYVSMLPVELTTNTAVSPGSSATRVQQLDSGTKLSLVFSAPISSRGQKVGDRLPVSLAEDLLIDGKLAARKGSSVDVVVTQVDDSHGMGLPGILSFSAQSIRLQDGKTMALLGVETMEGADHMKKALVSSIVPLGGLVVHGGDALNPAGARFEVEVGKPSDQSASLGSNR